MTYEEFQAGLAETPEILATVLEKHEADAIKHLTEGKKMVVTTMDEYQKNTQKAVDEATKRNHSDWEAKLEKVTGQKRPEGKKGLEWFDELSAKIKYVTEEGGDPNSAVVKAMQKELNDLKTSLSQKEQEALNARIQGEVASGIRSLQFAAPGHLKKAEEQTAYQKQKAQDVIDVFNARYTAKLDDSGNTVYLNKKGEAQVADGSPMTAEAIAARDFANDLAPKGRSQGGTGSLDNDPNSGNEGYLGATPEAIELKLAELGKPYMSEEWEKLYRAAMKAIGKVM